MVQSERAQHVVVIGGGNVAQIVFADLLDHLAAHVKGGMGRRPAELERIASEWSSPPCPGEILAPVIGHHVQVAIHDIAILHGRGDIGKDTGIVERIVGVQKPDDIALKQVKALVHGVVDAFVRLRENTNRVGAERLDDLQRSHHWMPPSITSISFSG